MNQTIMTMRRKKKQVILILAIVIAGFGTVWMMNQMQVKAKEHLKETQQHMAKEVLRFHVLANSDSEEDQALKMKVKEAVLDYMKQELPEETDLSETKTWAQSHDREIEEIGKAVVEAEGYKYAVKASVTSSYFPDKTYGDVTFPAGEYEALRIEIGDAKGQNWWCVLYPNLCFVDATHAVVPEEGKEELKEVLSDEEYQMVTATSEFKIKWFFLGE